MLDLIILSNFKIPFFIRNITCYLIHSRVPFMFSIRNHCQVNSILRHVAEILDYKSDDQLEELYNNSAWYFDRKYGHPGACYEAFKLAIT